MDVTFAPHYWIHFMIDGKWYAQNAHSLVKAIQWLAYFQATQGEITAVEFYGRG